MGIKVKGDFSHTEKFLKRSREKRYLDVLKQYGELGVMALMEATPKDTGKTSRSWTYEIEEQDGTTSLIFSNTNIEKGLNIAILLQHGHGTGTGGYVQGIDYINPALKPIFESIAESAWKEVTSL